MWTPPLSQQGKRGRPSQWTRLERLAQSFDLSAMEREGARRSLMAFTHYTFQKYQTSWHHRVMAEYLDQLVEGTIKRLLIFMPPRHGKSELVSRRLPAYILGRNPDTEIIAASYSAELAGAMNRDVQRIMDSPEYSAVFPGARLSRGITDRTVRNSERFEVVGRQGKYRSAGVGGGITGMGAHFAIIDDPVKDWAEANSSSVREAVWEWFITTLYPRLAPGGRLLLTMTRWHHDDLAGRILHQAKRRGLKGDQWTVINFPAVLDSEPGPLDPRGIGDALWPERYPLDALDAIRLNSETPYHWESLFQQRPTAREGGLFKEQYQRFYQVERRGDDPTGGGIYAYVLQKPGAAKPEIWMRSQLRMFMTADLAVSLKESADYCAFGVWGLTPNGDLLLLDVLRKRMEGPDQLPAMQSLMQKWRCHLVGIEKVQYQMSLVQQARRAGLAVVELTPKGDKIARAIPAAARWESGHLWLPPHEEWLRDYVVELAQFPVGRFDDQVDMTSYASEMAANLRTTLSVPDFGAAELSGLPSPLINPSYWSQ